MRRLAYTAGALLAAAVLVAAGVMWVATDPNHDTATCVTRSAGVTPAPTSCPEGAR